VYTAVADPLVGRLLEGRYRILDRIARGGMSTVYAAVDERLDRLVAVKVMNAALSADPAFSDRFAREARAAARLTHLNVVSVYDQGHDRAPDGHHVFLVMELVEGRTLRELLRERGRLTPAEALSILEPVLAALTAAHRAGLVHRDIKPENILISDDGVVKVADFGLARAIETDGHATATGIMMGTVAYCSPEQISRGRTDARSDVYAAGIVLFELLTGVAPYVGESAVNVAFQHVHNHVPPPSSRVRGIDPRLDELVLRATDSDPAGRPIDAGAFLAEMTDVRTDLDLPTVVLAGVTGGVTSAVSATGALGGSAARTGSARATTARTGRIDDNVATGPVVRSGGLRNAVQHTLAVNTRGHEDQFTDEGPPPPVVIPPPKPRKPRKQRSARSRRRRRALIVLIIVLLLGGSVGYASWWYGTGRFGHVPSLVGDSQSVATAALKKAGYSLSGTETQFSDTIPKDMIVSTSPAAGARIPHSHKVTLVLSKGKELVTIPTVTVGSSTDEARSLLGGVPIQVNAVTTSRPSDTVAAGTVLGTDPAGGTSVARGSQVQLILSSGPPILAVPDETNKSQQAATDDLKGVGFAVTVKTDYSPVVASGLVITQAPGAGASLAKFQTVTIDVSKGPAPVVLPAIAAGTSLPDAQAKLQALGLVVKVNTVYGGHLDVVLGMTPAAGTTVPYGSAVTLDVA
jgi:beta-lactam-binding protein with PASTA domain